MLSVSDTILWKASASSPNRAFILTTPGLFCRSFIPSRMVVIESTISFTFSCDKPTIFSKTTSNALTMLGSVLLRPFVIPPVIFFPRLMPFFEGDLISKNPSTADQALEAFSTILSLKPPRPCVIPSIIDLPNSIGLSREKKFLKVSHAVLAISWNSPGSIPINLSVIPSIKSLANSFSLSRLKKSPNPAHASLAAISYLSGSIPNNLSAIPSIKSLANCCRFDRSKNPVNLSHASRAAPSMRA